MRKPGVYKMTKREAERLRAQIASGKLKELKPKGRDAQGFTMYTLEKVNVCN